MTYSPQDLLNDVRTWIVRNNPRLTTPEREALATVPITYRPVPLGENSKWAMAHGTLLASTETDGSHTYVFGQKMGHGDLLMAQTLVHELGHVITNDTDGIDHLHDEAWATNVRRLGMLENVLDYDGNDDLAGNTVIRPWTDAKLAAYVYALPPVDWTESDRAIASA